MAKHEELKHFSYYLEQIAYKYDRFNVFDDFLTMIVCCMSMGREEQQYFRTIKKYGKEELSIFSTAFASVVLEMERKPLRDPFGGYFEEHFHNAALGQFFTPDAIGELMVNLIYQKQEGKVCFYFGLAVIVCFILILLKDGYCLADKVDDDVIERTGQIGDFIGGFVGSIWALAGVCLYFSAIKLQSREIGNQSREMAENQRMLNKQQLETAFYNLIRTQQDIKNEAKGVFYSIKRKGHGYSYYSETNIGGDFFNRSRFELLFLYSVYKRKSIHKWDEDYVEEIIDNFWQKEYQNLEHPDENNSDDNFITLINDLRLLYLASRYRINANNFQKAKKQKDEHLMCLYVYGHLYLEYDNSLGHYCRHLYNVVKFIDTEYHKALEVCNNRNDLPPSLKQQYIEDTKIQFNGYIGFVHSILSVSEMVILFYNSLLFPKSQELYVKWKLFENLRIESLLTESHVSLIPNVELKTKKSFYAEIFKIIENQK